MSVGIGAKAIPVTCSARCTIVRLNTVPTAVVPGWGLLVSRTSNESVAIKNDTASLPGGGLGKYTTVIDGGWAVVCQIVEIFRVRL